MVLFHFIILFYFYFILFSDSIALKRKISNMIDKPNYESDDSDVTFKRKRINVFNGSDTDVSNHDTIAHNTDYISNYIRITEDEYCDQGNLFKFVKKPGPQYHNAKLIEYFNLFFTPSLWAMMVEETNRYAEELLTSSTPSDKCRITDWYPVTILEMKAFVAVLLEMGIIKKPTINSYWMDNSRYKSWFKMMFSTNRFQNLLRCFHLINNETCFSPVHEKYYSCAKFNPILEHANQVF